MSQQLRALVGARVSVVQGPQKVAHIAQLETAKKWAEAKGYKIVGTFEDLGVSAEKPPEDRPDLGPWLTDEGAAKWDVIVWSKMDRAFRSTAHCVDFARWAEERRKVVAFADDGLVLDYLPKRPGAVKGIDEMMAELFVYLGSFFAQLELNRFKTRAQDAHRVLRQMDRWASGVPPLGFKVVDHPSGKGKGLDTDETGKALLHSMARRLLDGWSFIRIAAWLNEPYADPRCGRRHVTGCECRDSAALTNMDRARVLAGKPAKARPWTVNVVIDGLTSPRTQGLKMTGRGKHAMTVLDAEGEPIRLGPPTFDADTWKQIQDAAQRRKIGQRTPSKTKNPVLGVAVCGCTGCPACGVTEGICGASLAQQITRRKLASGEMGEWRSYRCGRTPLNCNGVSARADDVEFQLAHEFGFTRGDEPMTRRVFVPGEDHSAELEQVKATIDRLRMESDAGLLTTDEDQRQWLERLKAQTAKRDQLAVMPARAAGWTTEETGQTKAEAWKAADESERRQLYLDAGLRYVLCRKGERSYFDRSHTL
ncbi:MULTISPECIES: recombinase family protein [Mycolicibacterium]|uniref:Integrase n=1 Tax=Mycolicibacterium senegalense TaxID=1796 RepID=A0ABR5G239_9MYCO|nr:MULTISPECIES: recombinase family protein [Mycolicibacterium]KLI04082.1 integrase [Mycolicibacterium senegalense]KLO54214.1 integrase [Mycolicibacterium senegalense]